MANLINDVRIPIDEISGRMMLNVRVTGMRRWKVRMRIAVWLIQLAGVVAPIHFNVETE